METSETHFLSLLPNTLPSSMDSKINISFNPDEQIKAKCPSGDFNDLGDREPDCNFQERNFTVFRSNGQTLAIDSHRKETSFLYDKNGIFDLFGDYPCGPRGDRRSGDPSLLSSSSLSSSSSSSLSSSLCMDYKDKYNRPDFETSYENAKFFVLRSFNEDDVHKSIKYNVWSSTWYGNQKLDQAFRESVARLDDGIKCPIFLFFAVNGSGQFVGLAEMLGPVDFIKTMNFWQEDKWHGFFPVKWHIVKDIPASLFRDILLENNFNRPVIFCRDTQEVGIHHGLKMLGIFKDFEPKTCLLDDFAFYEQRERNLKVHKKIAARILPSKQHQDRQEPPVTRLSRGFGRGRESVLGRGERNKEYERDHESGLARGERNRGFEGGHESGVGRGERNRGYDRGHESGIAREEKNRGIEMGHASGHSIGERTRGFERGHARGERNRGLEMGHEGGLSLGERNRGLEMGHESGHARAERSRGLEMGHDSGLSLGERNRGFEMGHENGHARAERNRGLEMGHDNGLSLGEGNRGFDRGHEGGLTSGDRNRGFEMGLESGLARGERNKGYERGHEGGLASREGKNSGFERGLENGLARGERNRRSERSHEIRLAREARSRDVAFLTALTSRLSIKQ